VHKGLSKTSLAITSKWIQTDFNSILFLTPRPLDWLEDWGEWGLTFCLGHICLQIPTFRKSDLRKLCAWTGALSYQSVPSPEQLPRGPGHPTSRFAGTMQTSRFAGTSEARNRRATKCLYSATESEGTVSITVVWPEPIPKIRLTNEPVWLWQGIVDATYA
jgi:hypothetical protein